MKVFDKGRMILTHKIAVCSICGYRRDVLDGDRDPHCVGHSGMREGTIGTRMVYAAEYVPPPYVAEKRKKTKPNASTTFEPRSALSRTAALA